MGTLMPSKYRESGVRSPEEMPEFEGMLGILGPTLRFRKTYSPALGFGPYANVLHLGDGRGLAISTDGVGTKIIIAQMMEKYDTIGIDCVAMNVNDVICVGAEPIAMTDYVAVETTEGPFLTELAKGLAVGAQLSNISIPGGEIAQVPELLHRGHGLAPGFDLVGTCVGIVSMDAILTGQTANAGDAIIGYASAGIHSNGLTLARRILIDSSRWSISDYVPELKETLGIELLRPTNIYVRLAMALLSEVGLGVHALAHITSDGFLNLRRIDANVGFEIEFLPEPPPIFDLIRRAGEVSNQEMFTVYNMGIGFCAVVSSENAARAIELGRRCGFESWQIGECSDDANKTVHIPSVGLRSRDNHFEP